MNIVQTLTYDDERILQRYIVDLEKKVMWRNEYADCTRYPYRSSIQPWTIILFPVYIVGRVFFYGRPTWLWSIKEIPQPCFKIR